MSGYSKQQIDLMKKACLLCDNSSLEVGTGCVIVKNGEVIGEGWNVTQDVHAEVMALENTVNSGIDIAGSTVYVSRFPCSDCARELAERDIAKIFYMSDHFTSGNEAQPFLESSGILIKQIPENIIWDNRE